MQKQHTDKVKRAFQEFSERIALKENKGKERKELLKKIIVQFDLSPLEENFLRRHLLHEEDNS